MSTSDVQLMVAQWLEARGRELPPSMLEDAVAQIEAGGEDSQVLTDALATLDLHAESVRRACRESGTAVLGPFAVRLNDELIASPAEGFTEVQMRERLSSPGWWVALDDGQDTWRYNRQELQSWPALVVEAEHLADAIARVQRTRAGRLRSSILHVAAAIEAAERGLEFAYDARDDAIRASVERDLPPEVAQVIGMTREPIHQGVAAAYDVRDDAIRAAVDGGLPLPEVAQAAGMTIEQIHRIIDDQA